MRKIVFIKRIIKEFSYIDKKGYILNNQTITGRKLYKCTDYEAELLLENIICGMEKEEIDIRKYTRDKNLYIVNSEFLSRLNLDFDLLGRFSNV